MIVAARSGPAALIAAGALCAAACASAPPVPAQEAALGQGAALLQYAARRAEATRRQEAALRREAAQGADGWAKLWLSCSAADAAVTVDGAPAGSCADYAGRQLRVRPGRHLLEVRSGGSFESREMELGPGDDLALSIALSPAKGQPADDQPHDNQPVHDRPLKEAGREESR